MLYVVPDCPAKPECLNNIHHQVSQRSQQQAAAPSTSTNISSYNLESRKSEVSRVRTITYRLLSLRVGVAAAPAPGMASHANQHGGGSGGDATGYYAACMTRPTGDHRRFSKRVVLSLTVYGVSAIHDATMI